MARTVKVSDDAVRKAMKGQAEAKASKRRSKNTAADQVFEDKAFDAAAEKRAAKKDAEKAGTPAAPTVRRTSRGTAKADNKVTAAPKAKGPSKADQVRARFEKGDSLLEASKATGVPYPYVWDIARAWERSTGKTVKRDKVAAPQAKAQAKAASKAKRASKDDAAKAPKVKKAGRSK